VRSYPVTAQACRLQAGNKTLVFEMEAT